MTRFGGMVTQRDDNPCCRQRANKRDRPRQFRRHRHITDATAGGTLKTVEYLYVGGTYVLGRMGAAGPIFRRNMGAFQVNTRNVPGKRGILQRLSHDTALVFERIHTVRHQRRHPT